MECIRYQTALILKLDNQLSWYADITVMELNKIQESKDS
jgi:hypothetical protein